MSDSHDDGFLFALKLDGQGNASELSWEGVDEFWDDETFVWVHLDYSDEHSQKWLKEKSGIDPITCETLVSENSRPRCVTSEDGILVNLRGIDHSPDSDVEDMISLRMWVEHNRLITLRQHRNPAVMAVKKQLSSGKGPRDAVGILLELSDEITRHTGKTVSRLDDDMDGYEEQVIATETRELRSKIADIRRSAIGLRRYLSPQREAMTQLTMTKVSWVEESDRIQFREIADRVTRQVEELDAIRDRAAVTQEELASRLAEQSNRTMYILTIITGIFLPLGFLTGLLGINVGGMPGTDSGIAFWMVCGLLLIITIAEIIIFKRNKWL